MRACSCSKVAWSMRRSSNFTATSQLSPSRCMICRFRLRSRVGTYWNWKPRSFLLSWARRLFSYSETDLWLLTASLPKKQYLWKMQQAQMVMPPSQSGLTLRSHQVLVSAMKFVQQNIFQLYGTQMLRVIQASGAGAAGHHQHVLVLVAAVGEVGLDAHVDDLLRRQSSHLAALRPRLEEGEDIVVHLHLESLHGVDHHVLRCHAAQLALVLGQAHVVDAHLVDRAGFFVLIRLPVLVEVEAVDRLALQEVKDRDPAVALDSHDEAAREAQVEVDDGPAQAELLGQRLRTRTTSASRVFQILMVQSSPAEMTKPGSLAKLTFSTSFWWQYTLCACGSSVFQRIMQPSADPLSRQYPLGEKCTSQMVLRCPRQVARQVFSRRHHNFMVRSALPDMRYSSSSEREREVIFSMWPLYTPLRLNLVPGGISFFSSFFSSTSAFFSSLSSELSTAMLSVGFGYAFDSISHTSMALSLATAQDLPPAMIFP